MNIVVKKENISEAVSLINQVLKTPVVNQIFGLVHLYEENGVLIMRYNNSETEIKCKVECEQIDTGFECLVNFLKLKTSVSFMDSEIKLNQENGFLIVKSGRKKASLALMPVSEYYPSYAMVEGDVIEFKDKDLQKYLSFVKDCAVDVDPIIYPSFGSVCFDGTSGTLKMIALDGIILGVYQTPYKVDSKRKSIVPMEAVNLMSKIKDSDVEVVLNNNKVSIVAERFVYSTSLLDGNYPDTQIFFSNINADVTIAVEKESLISSINFIRSIQEKEDKIDYLIVETANGIATAKGKSSLNECSTSELVGDFKDYNSVFAVNGKKMKNLISQLDSELTLSYSNPCHNGGKIIVKCSDENYSGLIASLRV